MNTPSNPTDTPRAQVAANQVRQQYLDFFVDKCGHRFTPSSPVVPHNDPTLLFANAGMNQFKPYFLGTETPPDPPRAVNTQKCIRAGGKHNDLDDVGKDTYHHTFFEMLGNWSFGNYFKKEAIGWAWELLTDPRTGWGIDPERLHATYFEGDASEGLEPDTEAKELWLQFLPESRVHPGNKKDNFWEMGDTGPCGPCSELHYDRSPDKSGANLVNADGQDTVVEIWNLVFIQFNRSQSGSLESLPAKHVDTGMGFERIVRVLQGKESNYDTDVFAPYFTAIQQITGARAYTPGGNEAALADPINVAYRVIADHIRTLTFALSDGAHCGNTGRDSVLRTILRRAVRYGHQQLGVEEPFFYKLVPTVVQTMGDAFPELKANPDAVMAELKEEEESFRKTLARGIHRILGEVFDAIERSLPDKIASVGPNQHSPKGFNQIVDGGTRVVLVTTSDGLQEELRIPFEPLAQITFVKKHCPNGAQISGTVAFDLEATYGFPISLTCVMAEERGLSVDLDGYEQAKAKHAEVSRGDTEGGVDVKALLIELTQKHDLPDTLFLGYDATAIDGTQDAQHTSHRWLFKLDGSSATPIDEAEPGDRVALVTERTVFYAEAGGQVGDTGTIACQCGATLRVDDTQKIGNTWFHLGQVTQGTFAQRLDEARPIIMDVNADRRAKIVANHTTTHVMNRALRSHVNPEADQKGSLVDDEKLRFDFSCASAMTPEQAKLVEEQVNADIAADLSVHAQVAPQQDALKIKSLRAVFGEKYPDHVRVVSIGMDVDTLLARPDDPAWSDLSIEFCGGTHLPSTGDAEGFAIVSEEGVSKGVRRITALTGAAAHEATARGEAVLQRAKALAGTTEAGALQDGLAGLRDALTEHAVPMLIKLDIQSAMRELEAGLKKLQKEKAKQAAGSAVEVARKIADEQTGPIIVGDLGACDGGAIRSAMDVFRKKHAEAAVFLGGVHGEKVVLMAIVPKPLIAQGLKAGDWIKHVAPIVGGGGGGKPDSAQAGGKDPSKLPEALDAARAFGTDALSG